MIFIVEKEFLNPTTKAKDTVNLFVGQFREDNYVGLESVLFTPEIFNDLSQSCNAKIFKTDDIASALIAVVDTSDAVSLTAFYNLILKNMMDKPEQFQASQDIIVTNLATKLNNSIPGSLLENCKNLIYSIIRLIDFSANDRKTCGVGLGVASYLEGFEALTAAYIESQHETENTAFVKMKTCTDKVMLRLPTRTELLSDEISYADILPKRKDICEPYEYPAAYTVMYDEISSGIPKSYYPMIEGNSANNTLPIQENEQEFYDLLVQWIKNNVEEAYGKELEDKDLVIDKVTLDYLEHLLTKIYYWHWSHSSAVPKILDVDDEDDDVDTDINSSQSSYEFTIKAGQDTDTVIEGYTLLKNFVKEAAMKIDYKIYAEAIIRLLRWGTRKQTALIFEGFPYEFNLALGRRAAYNGVISDYQKLTDDNGNSSIPAAAIMMDVPLADQRLSQIFGRQLTLIPIPIGLRVVEQYAHKGTEKKIVLHKYISIIDVVMDLLRKKSGRSHNFDFVGIDMDDAGNIVMAQDIKYPGQRDMYKQLKDYYEKAKNSLLASPFFTKGCEDVFLELGSYDATKDYNFFTIMERFMQDSNAAAIIQSQSFKTKKELADKFESAAIMNTDNAICANLFRQYIAVLGAVFKSMNNDIIKDFSAILNVYKDVLVKFNYKGDSSFLTETKCNRDSAAEMYEIIVNGNAATQALAQEEKTAVSEESEKSIKVMQSFGNTEQKEEPMTAPEEPTAPEESVAPDREPEIEEPVVSEDEKPAVEEPEVESIGLEDEKPVVEPVSETTEEPVVEEDEKQVVSQTEDSPIESKPTEVASNPTIIEKEVIKEVKVPMTGSEFITSSFIDSEAASRITPSNIVCGGANGTIYCYFIVENINGDKVLTILEHSTITNNGITTKQFVELNTLKQWFFRQFVRLADNKPSKVKFESKKAMYDFMSICAKV